MSVEKIKWLVASVLAALLSLGYAASQWFAFQGEAAKWAQTIDNPQVKMLSLVMLLLVVGLGFVPTEGKA